MVDSALRNQFAVRVRLGHFDPRDLQPWGHWGLDKINTTAGIALAVDAARQSFVLLKNEKSTLPLRQGVKLAVLGPHAQATGAMLGNYHGQPAIGPVTPCHGLGR
jgi:beta-glucosidase